MNLLMDPRDESAGNAVGGESPHESPLPAGADYRDLVEGLPLIVYIDAPDAISPSLYVSPQTTELLGYTPEEWASSPDFFLNILHPDDRERVVAETAHMIETGERLKSEYRLLRRDGSVAWMRDEGVARSRRGGRATLPAGLHPRHHRAQAARDRATRERRPYAGDARRGARRRHHDRPRRRHHRIQPRGRGIFGHARDDAMGKQMVDLIVPPAFRDAHTAGFRHYLATGEGPVLGKRIEVSGMRADGSEFPWS